MSPEATAPNTAELPWRHAEAAQEPAWLDEVRLRAARRVLWLRHQWVEHHYADEQLLSITHSEVDRALQSRVEVRAAERRFLARDEHAAKLTAALRATTQRTPDPRLHHLITRLQLTGRDLALFTLTLAVAVDPALRRVFGYLSDLAEPADPTPALATALFELDGEAPPGPDSALTRWRLAEPLLDGPDAGAPTTGWRVDSLLARALAGAADWSSGASGRAVAPPAGPLLQPQALDDIVGFARAVPDPHDDAAGLEIELVGAPGSGRTTLAAQAATRLGLPLVAVDVARLADAPDFTARVIREARRGRLEGAVLVWENADELTSAQWAAIPAQPLAFVSVQAPLRTDARSATIRRSVRCEPIDRRARMQLWSALSELPAPSAVTEWALRPQEVCMAARVAAAGDREVSEVCRRLLTASLPELASPLPLPFAWSDLVLAPRTLAHLHEFEDQARHRGPVLDAWGFSRLTSLGRGTTALFCGASGTGKTMAAQVLARSLGLELLRVDLAGVVNKYIGETEKHLRQLFDVSERAPVLLLFDEADALFGKRSQVNDAHDRYANIEIDYLLQRMERFDGVAVLATNRKSDLDTAFVRRLRFIIDFAPPSVDERERLWRKALEGATDADGHPLTGELDWAGLARELDLTGAGIKSAALAAAFLAHAQDSVIGQHHVLAAGARELEKQGIVLRPGQMEPR
jgi:hypothetical protein